MDAVNIPEVLGWMWLTPGGPWTVVNSSCCSSPITATVPGPGTLHLIQSASSMLCINKVEEGTQAIVKGLWRMHPVFRETAGPRLWLFAIVCECVCTSVRMWAGGAHTPRSLDPRPQMQGMQCTNKGSIVGGCT